MFFWFPPINVDTLKKLILSYLKTVKQVPIWEIEQKYAKNGLFSRIQAIQAINELVQDKEVKKERGWLSIPEKDDDPEDIIIPIHPWVPI